MMNERIRELAEQAREYAATRHPVSNITLSVNSDLFEQKFAELLIQECAQACINMGNDYEIKSAGQYQAELFAFAIKKHFGVEQ